jgi:hypothetical protein
VAGYFQEHGFLRLLVKPDDPLDWYRGNVRRAQKDAKAPRWRREGLGGFRGRNRAPGAIGCQVEWSMQEERMKSPRVLITVAPDRRYFREGKPKKEIMRFARVESPPDSDWIEASRLMLCPKPRCRITTSRQGTATTAPWGATRRPNGSGRGDLRSGRISRATAADTSAWEVDVERREDH